MRSPRRPYALAPPEPRAVAPISPPSRPRETSARPWIARDDPRHRLYRRLAATRRLLAAWRDVGDFVADPGGRPLRPTEGIAFVGAILELRDRLAKESAPSIGLPGQAGAEVTALGRQQLPLTAFQHLGREQRLSLAADWQSALDRLNAVYAEISRAVRRQRRTAVQRAARNFARALVTDRLDLTLFVLGLAALGLALIRSW